jgi:hypothetical protein
MGFLNGFSWVRGLHCQQLRTRVALPNVVVRVALPTIGDRCCLSNNRGRRLPWQQLGTYTCSKLPRECVVGYGDSANKPNVGDLGDETSKGRIISETFGDNSLRDYSLRHHC